MSFLSITKAHRTPPGISLSLAHRRWRRAVGWILFAAFFLVSVLPGVATAAGAGASAAAITEEILADLFPGGGTLGPVSGNPPARPVYRDSGVVGYVFSTRDAVGSVGFSGNPIDIYAGLDIKGRITGAVLHAHNEPILVIGIPEARLIDYVSQFAGIDVSDRAGVKPASNPAKAAPDVISGASVSSAVIRNAIFRSARAVARSRHILTNGTKDRLDRETFSEASWAALMEDGSISRLRLDQKTVAKALGDVLPPGDQGDSLFIDLYTGLISPPRVGENLIGKLDFNELLGGMAANDQIIVVVADGLYSFKGTGYIRSGLFDRIQLVQGASTIRLAKDRYRNVETFRIPGAPEFREIGIFTLPAETGFDPLKPWRLELLVNRETANLGTLRAVFPLTYTLPARYRLAATAAQDSANGTQIEQGAQYWIHEWETRAVHIVILGIVLAVLSGVLFFQDRVVADTKRYHLFRHVFLVVIVVWLGWIAGGQLSIIHVLTFIHSLLGEFHWEFFLLDPVTFLLWGYVAVALLFWGRGVFCGWLCPFGALQELLNEGARKLKVPQVAIPFAVHERLWPIKYVIFLGLLAVSLHSTNLAIVGSEVEPFKTAITLKFARGWPFVTYAIALLAAGLFIERFFCRYLCPLGAALAIPARIRMFDWLKRRFQCGEVCNLCAGECGVQAIHPEGNINPNECIYCLNCQTIYHDESLCPPLVAQRKRRERRQALAGDAKGVIGGDDNDRQ
ncbi:MAG: regulatory protein NosR [Rhodospirillales bacterium]|nr:regulatory protein NosR [Rhodospirillales bacterium]